MNRDMDLIRKILFAIEDKFIDVAIYDLSIDGCDKKTVAYHCDLLHQAGLVKDYKAQYAGNELYTFGVSSLTWEGHNYLDKIRSETIWNKTKAIVKERGLPLAFETIKEITSELISAAVKGAVAGLK